jgi:hypothetical protein
MVAELHPNNEADPVKAETIAALKPELETVAARLEPLQQAVHD